MLPAPQPAAAEPEPKSTRPASALLTLVADSGCSHSLRAAIDVPMALTVSRPVVKLMLLRSRHPSSSGRFKGVGGKLFVGGIPVFFRPRLRASWTSAVSE